MLNGGVAVPELSGRVVDEAGLFAFRGTGAIEPAIAELEQKTGGQMVVWTIPSLDGEPIETVSMRAAEKWKIGHKGQDNGVLLTIAVKERAVRLEVGYGWEGCINDARAGDIIRSIGSYFRTRDYVAGVVHAVKMVEWYTSGAPVGSVVPWWKTTWGWVSTLLLFGVLLAIGYGFFRTLKWLFTADLRDLSGGSGSGSRGGGGSFGGGGFRGGGGGFGGGGASGRW